MMYESVDVVAHKMRTPSVHHSLTEFGRAFAEIVMLGSVWPFLGYSELGDRELGYKQGRTAPGDGHPVLVLPGFLGSDLSTALCRRYLQRQGLTALPWLQGRNTGRAAIQSGLLERFLRVHDEYQCPVSLVGHSLGGVFARELARHYPEKVRAVVTLGSPFGSVDGSSVAHIVRGIFERVAQRSVQDLQADLMSIDARQPPGVPATAIYSRADGVVHWQSCLEQETHETENIEVFGSHCGMVVNPSVLVAMAGRLVQPDGGWRKFRAAPSVMPGVSHTLSQREAVNRA